MKRIIYYLFKLKYELLRKAKIGKNFVVGRNVNIDKNFKCGNYVYIGQNNYIGSHTTFGHWVMVSDAVNIVGSDHVFDKVGTPIILSGRPKYQPHTEIGNDVWIGHGVTIIRGIKIGDGAIIGANSFVNKNVEPYSIYGGIPAKFIKKRFSNESDTKKHIKQIQKMIKEME